MAQRRLPPLNAVRAFEAAARAGGFVAAAAELHVSANAVGRLVKVLEDSLGAKLFRRLPGGVVMTDAGRKYLSRVGSVLDQLADASQDVRHVDSSHVLAIGAPPSFLSRWLSPRIGRLLDEHPELNIRLFAHHADFTGGEGDVVI